MADYTSFDAGTAYLTVAPRLARDFRAEVERQVASVNAPNLDVSLNLTGATDFRASVEAQLNAASQRTVDVALNLDSTSFQARLNEISATSNFSVDVDLNADFAGFRAELEALSRTSGSEIGIHVDLDTRTAAAELEAFLAAVPRSVTIRVDVDTRTAADEIDNLLRRVRQRHTIDIDANTGPLDTATNKANKASFALKGIGLIKWPAIVAGVTALTTAVGGLAGMAGGAAAAMGVLAAPALIGSMGLAGAFTAGADAQKNAADDAADAAERQQDALEGVADAQEAVNRSHRSLESAERSAVSAQKALNDAYRESSRELRDMNNQLKDAELSQEGAAIAVARAKENLARVQRDPKASKLDRQEASLQLRTAQQRYDESKITTADLRTDTAVANAAGVAGSDKVVDAKQGVKDSNQGVIDAQRAVADSVRDLAKAQKELAEAGDTAGASQDKLAEALAKLSPNARDFYDKIKALGPAWKEMQQVVQDNMFEGLGDAVTDFSDSQLGHLTDGFGRLAGSVNTMLKGTLSSLDEMMLRLGGDGTMDKFLSAAESAATGIGPLITGIVESFVEMGAQMGDTIGPLLTQWGESIAMLGEPLGKLGAAFASGMTDGDNGIASLVVALADGLLPLVDPVLAFFEQLGNMIRDNLPQISRIGGELVEGFGGALEVLEPLLPPILDAIEWMAGVFADNPGTFMAMFAGWNVLANITAGVGSFVKSWDNIGSLITKIQNFGLAQKIASAATAVWTGITAAFNVVMAANPIVLVALAIAALVAGIVIAYKNVDWFREAVDKVWATLVDWAGWLGGFFVDLWNGLYENVIRPVWDSIVGAINWARDGISGAFTSIGNGVDAVGGFFSDLGDTVSRIWKSIVNVIAIAVGQIGRLLQSIKIPDWVPAIGGKGLDGLGGKLVAWSEANRYAMGGHISGPGGPQDDLVPAWLSNGEYVVNAAATAKHGPLIEAINEDRIPAFKDGGQVDDEVFDALHPFSKPQRPLPSSTPPRIASTTEPMAPPAAGPKPSGGWVDQFQSDLYKDADPNISYNDAVAANPTAVPAPSGAIPSSDGLTSVGFGGTGGTVQAGVELTSDIQTSMWDAVRTAFPDAVLTSGTRYADVGSGFDNHMGARAIDVAGPRMPDYARWVYALNKSQQVEELIHAPLDGWENLKKGSPLNFGAATDAEHLDHVHFAMATPVTAAAAPAAPAAGNSATGAGEFSPSPATADLDASTDALTGMGDTSGLGEAGSETTWSGLAGSVASAFVSGMVGDALGVFGIPDEQPAFVKAGKLAYSAFESNSGTERDSSNIVDSPAGTGLGVGDPASPAAAESAAPKSFDHVYDPAGGAEQWQGVIEAVFGLGGWSLSDVPRAVQQTGIESGGNPKAVNRTDINAQNGTPSGGLLQVIQPTFDAFKSPQLADDLFDPAANIFAAANYVMTDPKFKGKGIAGVWPTTNGYANGGSVWGPGGPTDDAIPAWLSNREFVMNAASADANRPLLEAMNNDANVINNSLAPMFRGIRNSSSASESHVDNSMVVNLTTPDVDSAFNRAKAWEAQRSLTYTTPGR